jgi:hypothetical protein
MGRKLQSENLKVADDLTELGLRRKAILKIY